MCKGYNASSPVSTELGRFDAFLPYVHHLKIIPGKICCNISNRNLNIHNDIVYFLIAFDSISLRNRLFLLIGSFLDPKLRSKAKKMIVFKLGKVFQTNHYKLACLIMPLKKAHYYVG